jgi:hypothetical protein
MPYSGWMCDDMIFIHRDEAHPYYECNKYMNEDASRV